MSILKLEQLPDEVLLEIFIYLRPFDVVNSFGQLNYRLEQTIGQYRRDADLHHLTYRQFQRWSNHLLSYTATSVVNLVVSNWNSPGQISLFNCLVKNYNSLRDLFPRLKQLRLIDFTNDDIDILTKLQAIEKVLIDADALMTLSHSTHLLLDKYLFCSSYQFKEVRLWGVENGIHLQHDVNIIENCSLERLTISVAHLDDLLLTLRRSRNLRHMNVEVVQFSTKATQQKLTVDMLPKNINFFHFQTTDQKVLSYGEFEYMISNMPTIESLSMDIDTNDFEYADGYGWYKMMSNLNHLKHLFFKLRICQSLETVHPDVDSVLQSFKYANIPICCYIDSKVLHIDSIPYDMTKFNTNMSVTISPGAKFAKANDTKLFQQKSKRIQTLIIDGQHEPTPIDDWLFVMDRFSTIEILQINAVNISEDDDIEIYDQQVRLPNLRYLHYIRSTMCKVHVPFFKFLAMNTVATPNLKALSMMYGDLVFLCKRLSGCALERISELWLYGGSADGHIIVKDIDLVLRTFPCLRHFVFNNHSGRFMNRSIKSMVEMVLRSSPKLIGFRVSCNRGSLKLLLLMSNETCRAWIKAICGVNEDKQIHIIVNEKMLSIWK